MIKILLNFIVIFYLLFPIQDARADCLEAGVIHVAPYGFKSSGEIKGIHWDALDAISKESGICINKQLLPYKRVWQSLKNGSSDISIISVTKDRISLVSPIVQMSTVKVVVIPHTEIKITQYDDLKSLAIGKMRGTKLSVTFDADNTINKIPLNNYLQAHEMLSNKRLDAIAGSEIGIIYYYGKHGRSKSMSINEQFLLEERERWLHMAKKSPNQHLIPKLRDAVIRLKKQDLFEKIKQRYLVSYE